MGELIVIEPGLLTTIQDGGRWGYQQYGVAVAGAMDTYSMELANRLLGNSPQEALLEMTLIGGVFEVTKKSFMAISGADMGAKIDGRPISLGQSFALEPGQKLSFSFAKNGVRTYLAIAGGFDIEEVLGSLSTYLPGKMGGYKGRKLESGDALALKNMPDGLELRKYPIEKVKKVSDHNIIRVVMGPQDDYFSEEAIDIFLKEEYRLTDQVDRMGYRLSGKVIEHLEGPDIISDGILFGSVQISGDGQPTIMMADHQTTGGYTKIATVISPDLPILAQLNPGKKVKFKKLEAIEAQEVYRAWRSELDKIEEDFVVLNGKEEEMEKLNVESIGKLMDYFTSSNVGELVFDLDDFHLELRKGNKDTGKSKEKTNEAREDVNIEKKERTVSKDPSLVEVEAPVDGVCYRAPGEGEAPFIEVGQKVKKGDTLLIIEVMKMMNEVVAPSEGHIVSIDFENEERVEAGTVIVTIK